MHTILFVCTGNTCRSPMAEAVAQRCLDEGLLGDAVRYLAASAGVAAADGVPPTQEAVDALQAVGIAHDGRSKMLTPEMIVGARHVLCMTEGHRMTATALVGDQPDHVAKIVRLDPDGDVDDPIGLGREAYDALVARFMELIPLRLKEVLSHEDRTGVGSSGS